MTEERIKTWSFSRWDRYVKCAYAALLSYVHKADEGGSPKSVQAMQRGSAVHDAAEQWVRGEIPEDEMPKELKKFEENFARLRQQYADEPDTLVMEEEWGFDEHWQVCNYWGEDIWLRMKLDRLEWLDEAHSAAELVDYKTGKKFGNEVKHNQQGTLYVVGAFMRYPELQGARVKFEYLDEGKPAVKTYSREQAMALLPSWDKRGKEMTTATRFPPRPNKVNCRFCPFGPNNGGSDVCEYGVEV